MKALNLVILALLTTLFSCKKSSSTTSEPDKYMDFTAGTALKYQTTNNLTAGITLNTLTSTNRDSSINGKSYHVFTNSNGTPNEYYNISGTDYYTFRSLGAISAANVETIYLKDNAVGTTWSQLVNVPIAVGSPTTVPVTLTNTVAEKGISRTVSGIAYTDVTRVTTTIAVSGLPAGSVTTDIQSYYARKKSLIESKNKISVPLLTINVDQNTILIP